MEVFGKGTPEGVRPLLPPGTCWICDQSPDQEGYRVIDTRRNARPGGPQVHESVRKYICEPCARQMGGAMGMVPQEAIESARDFARKLQHEASDLRAELDRTRGQQVRVVAADEIADVVSETVRAELAKQVKPRAAAKKPASE
jgi:hypothetical protein